jgi:NADH-quinone oxidoreductase subunit H
MDGTLLAISVAGIVLVLVIVLTFAPVLVWADRRQSAMIQDRIGPIRAGIPIAGKNIALWGLLHPLADALKFMWKEDFIPPRADKLLHAVAPIISVVPAIAAFTVIPMSAPIFADYLTQVVPAEIAVSGVGRPVQVASINMGILFLFAAGGTGVLGAALAGYCSDNKYSLLGGVRAASQMVSYEVTLGLSLVGCFMIYNTLLLENMVEWQRTHSFLTIGGYNILPMWGVFLQPHMLVVFLAASIAETKRIPFDVPEGESELAAGYFTEYSGMKFGMFMMGEYIEMVALSAVVTVMFFGGYDVPVLMSWAQESLPNLAVVALSVGVFLLKVVVLCWLQLMIRWTLPRFRYDQIMAMCWRYMLPLSLANVFVTGGLVLFFQRFHG